MIIEEQKDGAQEAQEKKEKGELLRLTRGFKLILKGVICSLVFNIRLILWKYFTDYMNII